MNGRNDGSPVSPERRRFLERLCIATGAGAALIPLVPALGFTVAPMFRRHEPVWRKVGPVGKFRVGETVLVRFENSSVLPWDGVTGHSGAWLRRSKEEEFIAFAVNCTHLGCPVRWEPDANLFLCPCHGGVYYSNGDVAGGPPPRALFRYRVRTRDSGVEIETGPIPLV